MLLITAYSFVTRCWSGFRYWDIISRPLSLCQRRSGATSLQFIVSANSAKFSRLFIRIICHFQVILVKESLFHLATDNRKSIVFILELFLSEVAHGDKNRSSVLSLFVRGDRMLLSVCVACRCCFWNDVFSACSAERPVTPLCWLHRGVYLTTVGSEQRRGAGAGV